MTPHPRVSVSAALAALALVVACASPAPSAVAPAAAGATIELGGFAFKPTALEVTSGTKVTFTNKDGATHTATSGRPGTKDGKFANQLQPGASAAVTLDTAGTYDFFCEIHTSMTGKLTVK